MRLENTKIQLLEDVEVLEEQWKLFMQAVRDSAETVLGRRRGTVIVIFIKDICKGLIMLIGLFRVKLS